MLQRLCRDRDKLEQIEQAARLRCRLGCVVAKPVCPSRGDLVPVAFLKRQLLQLLGDDDLETGRVSRLSKDTDLPLLGKDEPGDQITQPANGLLVIPLLHLEFDGHDLGKDIAEGKIRRLDYGEAADSQ
jgi:hypothetical protein